MSSVKAADESARAAAKVNLSLRLTGRYADGRHRLASLVVFAAGDDGDTCSDRLDYAPDGAWQLTCRGRFAAQLCAPQDNLVWQAAEALARRLQRPLGGRLTLTKNLPLMAGLGGGSSDAAAALRLLARVWGASASLLPPLAEKLGADVPAALYARACFVQGWGEQLTPLRLPRCGLLLVAPPHGLATGAVFDAVRATKKKFRPPTLLPAPKPFATVAELGAWIGAEGNDLRPAAQKLYPPLGALLRALAAVAPAAYGMSGSGPACFALFANVEQARRAARALRRDFPQHWVASAACGEEIQ